MRGPSLQNAAAVSLMLHLAILLFSVIVMHASRTVVLPSPYTVSLVSPSGGRASGERVPKVEESKSAAVEKVTTPEESNKVTRKDNKADEKILDDRMAELTALANLKKKSAIRKKMTEISGKAGSAKSAARSPEKQGAAGGPRGTPADMYIARISDAIRDEWVWPEVGKKELEAVVSVTIRRDGYIKIDGIEKSSGNVRFDNSALHAITKANPVTPPPYEMEIGIRFKP